MDPASYVQAVSLRFEHFRGGKGSPGLRATGRKAEIRALPWGKRVFLDCGRQATARTRGG